MTSENYGNDRIMVLELDNIVADQTMDEAIANYDRAIGRLNMLLVVCGVVMTISMTALTNEWEDHIYNLFLIFLAMVTVSLATSIIGLFKKRCFEGSLNPNSDSLRHAESLEAFYNESIDSKLKVASDHMDATDEIWVYIKAAYIALSLSLFVLAIIIIQLMIE